LIKEEIPLDVSGITADMTVEDLLERYPQASGFFLRYGIRCFSCSGVIWGTIGEVLRRKGVTDVDAALPALRSYILEDDDASARRADNCTVR
jgi:hypothetical protein